MNPDRRGRARGPGRLVPVRRGNGPLQWTLFYSDATGRRRCKALSTDKRIAERLRSDMINQRDLRAAGLGAEEGQSMPLQELVDLFLEDLKTRSTHAYHYNAWGSLQRTLKALGIQRVRDLQPIMAIKYRARLARDDGLSNTTANMQVAHLGAVLNWGVKAGLIAENPIRNIGRLPQGEKHQKRVRRAMNDDEIARFLDAAAQDDADQAAYVAAETTIANGTRGPGYAAQQRRLRVPQAAMWRAFLETGARYFELVSVTWADVDLEAGTMRLRATTTKSGKLRYVPVLDGLVAELRALRAIHEQVLRCVPGDGDRVFLTPTGEPWPKASVNAMRLFDRVCALAKIERINVHGESLDIHALRHSAATRMARRGVPMTVTQKILGHADARMTGRVYTHLDIDDMRDALEAAGGCGKVPVPRLVRGVAAEEATA